MAHSFPTRRSSDLLAGRAGVTAILEACPSLPVLRAAGMPFGIAIPMEEITGASSVPGLRLGSWDRRTIGRTTVGIATLVLDATEVVCARST